jgi:hypothetical protein
MPAFVNPDTIQRPSSGLAIPSAWGDCVNDDLNALETSVTFLNGDVAWTNVTVFTGTWVAGGVQPRFSKAGNFVTMQGQIQTGTINTAAFTLPVGYRPSETVVFAIDANAAFGRLSVATTGVVTPTNGATTNVGIWCTFSIL